MKDKIKYKNRLGYGRVRIRKDRKTNLSKNAKTKETE